MSERKQLVEDFIQALFTRGDLSAVDTYLSPGFIDHDPTLPSSEPGPGAMREAAAYFRRALPDWHSDIEQLIAEGDLVVERFTARGTHTGELMGVAPTGRELSLRGINIFRVHDGQITERWGRLDQLGLLRQLGLAPRHRRDRADRQREAAMPANGNPAESNKALVRRFYQQIDDGNLEAMDELVTEDYLDHSPPPFPGIGPGREGLKQAFRIFWDATPGRHDIEDQIAEGDKVVTRLTAHGVHQQDLPGIPATGRQVTMTATVIHRIENGKIAEKWSDKDALGFLQQLDVLPTP